jgi:hypothetical protein
LSCRSRLVWSMTTYLFFFLLKNVFGSMFLLPPLLNLKNNNVIFFVQFVKYIINIFKEVGWDLNMCLSKCLSSVSLRPYSLSSPYPKIIDFLRKFEFLVLLIVYYRSLQILWLTLNFISTKFWSTLSFCLSSCLDIMV